jgi:hypothetical protein
MNTQLATTEVYDRPLRRTWRARAVATFGPLTAVGGVAWALFQPYRITLLHPHGQSFWWLAVQPPLLVVGVGLLFTFLIAPSLQRDLEEEEA